MTPTRARSALVTAAATALVVLGAPLPASATQGPWCGLHWGSLPEATAVVERPAGQVTDVRAGQHPCFDRLVVDLEAGRAGGYDVRYVDQVSAQGSGTPVPVDGGAVLQVVVRAPAYDASRGATHLPADPAHVVDVRGARTLEQVAWAGSFEGQTSLAVGTRARLPFRVLVLDGAPGSPDGARVVVDVAHHW
ncbi:MULTISPECIES: AMIN-like domain-containing (lipo)protein [unclassified Modestobacter]